MTYPLIERTVAGRSIRVMATVRSDGDFHPDRSSWCELQQRHQRLTGRSWWQLDQVHGVECFEVAGSHGPSRTATAATGDVITTTMSSIDLAIWSADCAPIVLIGDDGCVVAAHGGWRGLAAGVLDVAIDAVAGRGAGVVGAVLGPVIHPCCYAFGADEMGQLAAGVHTPVEHLAGRTSSGDLALDVPAAVRHALAARGVELDVVGPCTGCDRRWFSHRVRGECERHATVVSVEETT